jgi:hypothetical protein
VYLRVAILLERYTFDEIPKYISGEITSILIWVIFLFQFSVLFFFFFFFFFFLIFFPIFFLLELLVCDARFLSIMNLESQEDFFVAFDFIFLNAI